MPRLLLLLPTETYRAEDFVRAAERLGVELTVASEEPNVLAATNPAGYLALDFDDPARAAAQAADFARRHPIAAVVGVDDRTAVVAAAVAQRLGLPANPVAAARAARNKAESRERLAQAGLPVPRFARFGLDEEPGAVARAVARRIGFPCVVKPLVLSASRGVIRADDEASLAAAVRRVGAILRDPEVAACGEGAREILVEAFVPGREVALEGLLAGGRLHVLALFDKPDPLDGPYFAETIYVTPSRLPAGVQEAIAACTARAAAALGLAIGPVHAELRVGEAGPVILEVAARSIGGRCSRALRFDPGVSLEELILAQALGRELPPPEREHRAAGVLMLPVPRAGRLVAISGQAEARAVPGVEEVLITAHPGQAVRPLPEGAQYLGFVVARGDSPEAVEEALREAWRRLAVVIEPA
ncbi:MAG TPA: ATP-grasp domain-containing protein [Thermodesulfobacteriota bacterium]|nr:ATP-grasp domain-containing protein [Thermodesulfobacteriota bacterium]